MHLVGFIIRIFHDARSLEYKISLKCFTKKKRRSFSQRKKYFNSVLLIADRTVELFCCFIFRQNKTSRIVAFYHLQGEN